MTEKRHNTFLNHPTYPGGSKAMNEFITQNLQYPEQALQNNISGSVYLRYIVNDEGIVESVQILKSLGYGCDEEAIRIVKLLKFGSVSNRGIRLKSTKKIKINFNFIKIARSVVYNIKENSNNQAKISYKIQI